MWLFIIVESETLAFNSCLINKNSCIGLKTSESENNMFINFMNLSDCAWILQYCNCLLFNCKNYTVTSLDTNCSRATIDSFKGILYLEEITIWSKYSDSFIVCWHFKSLYLKFINQFILIYSSTLEHFRCSPYTRAKYFIKN
jgi:hypothetical protein